MYSLFQPYPMNSTSILRLCVCVCVWGGGGGRGGGLLNYNYTDLRVINLKLWITTEIQEFINIFIILFSLSLYIISYLTTEESISPYILDTLPLSIANSNCRKSQNARLLKDLSHFLKYVYIQFFFFFF